MTAPLYAIGDIHGQLEMLDAALQRIKADGGEDARIVFLGDYTDRGPDSRGVIERLMAGQEQGRDWICLKGNHDRMFEWFLEETPRHDPHLLIGYHWLHERIGGVETLASYGLTFEDRTRLDDLHARAKEVIPAPHAEFLRSLPALHETPELAFVHAGIRPGVPLAQQHEDELVWIRQPFHDHTGPHPKLIVHGHTPVDRPSHYGNRVNLDSGAGYGRPLSAAVFEGRDCWLLTEAGRVPLKP
ncbi:MULTISPECIES: metallophosphoesterase family protein [Leisingera]|jgi:serine/threonine protein phosphatase 1|uniref:metallophosphoesterase family protein n=1 Tax=Leisingera TaxID=191028 RepID=UPI00115322B0|nr:MULTISPECIES: metallophosphoesterase family protein [Leisingera]QDI77425.1 serine/threonine protein phosphatase [Leisingera aquaemixtae]